MLSTSFNDEIAFRDESHCNAADSGAQPQVSMQLTASLGELAIFVSGRTTEIWWPPEACLLIWLHACAQLPFPGHPPASKPVSQPDAKAGATYALHNQHCLSLCIFSMSWLVSLCANDKVAAQNSRHTEVM